jgi:hypothetical protein
MPKRPAELFREWPAAKLWEAARTDSNPVQVLLSRIPDSRRLQSTARKPYQQGPDLRYLFLPIAVNPSDPHRTKMINETFVYASDIQNADGKGIDSDKSAINWDAQALRRFIDQTLRCAETQREAASELTQRKRQLSIAHSFVLGERGIGKTHLQNFILSQYSSLFDQHKIVWIRLNLIRDFGDELSLDLNYWVRAQITKVLCRYYDSRSSYCRQTRPGLDIDFRLALSQYLLGSQMDHSDQKALREKMNAMLARFQESGKDADIQPSWVPVQLADQVFQVARAKGLAFVVVFDGLDLLSRSDAQQRRLEGRCEVLRRYLNQETTLPCYHLIFVREETLLLAPGLLDAARGAPYKNSVIDFHRIAAVRPHALVSRRLDFAKTDSEFATDSSRIAKFELYLNTTPSGLLDSNHRSLNYTAAIGGLYGLNARSATQLLSVAANHFLLEDSQTEDSQGYRFTEMSMIGARAFAPEGYRYRRNIDGRLERITTVDFRHYDTIFLPSVVAFPFEDGASASSIFSRCGLGVYLWAVRILQATRQFNLLHHIGVPILDLVELMTAVFNYPAEETRICIEDLCDVELLQMRPLRGSTPQYPENCSVEISSKGAVILDTYLSDVTYLGICGFTLPLPSPALPDVADMSGLVQAKAYAFDGLKDWVVTKQQNAFTVGQLLVEANAKQKSAILDRTSFGHEIRWIDSRTENLLTNMLREDCDIYQVGEMITSRLPKIADRAVSGLVPDTEAAVLAELESISKRIADKEARICGRDI